MIFEGVTFLAFGGGALGNLFAQWEAAGVFTYALPFLLIFALVFAILGIMPIFQGNKGINAVISLAVALMALQFNFVSIFFAEIFPRLGIALSIVLVLMILLGLFMKDDDKANKVVKWIFAIAVIVTAIVVISNSLGSFGFGGFGGGVFWDYLRYNAAQVVIFVAVIAGVIAIIASQSPRKQMKEFPLKISPVSG